MLSIKNNFLFIHVPKTGGNSIQIVLEKYSDDKIVDYDENMDTFEITNETYNTTKHSTLSYYKNVLDPKIYDSLFKFCVVRNPWEMVISYYFSQHWKNYKEFYPIEFDWDIDSCIKLLNREIKPLEYFIGEDFSNINFIRYENLNEDFKKILEKLNIKGDLPHKNKSNHKHYSEYYDEELIKLVSDKFEKEIKFFGYEFLKDKKLYSFKNLEEKERIYDYWNHNQSGQPICSIINENLKNENFNFCEIGCQLAGLSDLIIHEFENSCVWAIDITNHNPNIVKKLQNEFPERFHFLLESSLESYKNFNDGFFDMIYIDTDPHKYNQLEKEIEYWVPKVKTGGIISFHDYDHPRHPDVKKCLDNYCNLEGLKLYKTDYYNVFFIKK